MSTEADHAVAVVAVACSGGRDSIALLHATASAARDVPGLAVVALHVHHGLSLQADAWQAHVDDCCRRWADAGLPVRALTRRVVCVDDGGGIEAAARRARYAALADMAREVGATLVLLAHHRRDQAETVLLQALRGGSAAGLAAMPREAWRDGLCWVRPWLDQPRRAIEAYVAHHRLVHVDDDSNDSRVHARNRLRLDVWPALQGAFPEAEANLAASARRVADTQAVAEMFALTQLKALAQGARQLDAVAWSALPAPLRRMVLLAWWRAAGVSPEGSWVTRLSDEVPLLVARQRAGRWPGAGVTLYRGVLTLGEPCEPALASAEAQCGQPLCTDASEAGWGAQGGVVLGDVSMPASGALRLAGWGGALKACRVPERGVPWSALQHMRVAPREAGAQFQAGPGRPARSLKKQFQQAAVPAWLRQGPLCWRGDSVLFVPGLGMDARHWAAAGEPQWALQWVPDPE